MAPGEDCDSGMGSMPDSSKDCTPEKPKQLEMIEFGEEVVEDETLGERLWGLTEMFPDTVRNASSSLMCGSSFLVKSAYTLSRSAMFIFFSSSAILFAPVLFEVERAQFEEAQKSQQKQVLLGPNTALAGGLTPGGMPPVR